MSDVMSGNTVDSRDVIARIEELEAEREDVEGSDEQEAATQDDKDNNRDPLSVWDESEDGEELRDLKAFVEEAGGYAGDWKHGETLISDGYFEQYARDLADDIGAIPRDAGWPCTCIDWEQAAKQLQMDYSGIEYRGSTWWVR